MRRNDDCLRACAATVLGIDYEDTPTVVPDSVPSEEWWDAWYKWAAANGLTLDYYPETERSPIEHDLWIGIVDSLNVPDRDHAVVMRRTGLLHDPCPSDRDRVSLGDVKYALTLG